MHAFISYLRDNADEVDRLADDLRGNGVVVWLDRERLKVGEVWQEGIRHAISSGAYFIACFSAEYEQRDTTYMDEELALAMGELQVRPGGRWFLPVRLSPCDLSKRPARWTTSLSALHWVDLWDNWDRGVRQILDVVTTGTPSHHSLRSSPAATSDPYAGTTTDQLLEQIGSLTIDATALGVAKRHSEAADCFASAVRIWEAIEAHRLDSFDRQLFLINAFNSSFNLTLTLYKANQRLRSSNEAVKAAQRYAALIRQGEAGIEGALDGMERRAEALMSITREFVRAASAGQELEAHRVHTAVLEQLADANPISFRHSQGVALRDLALEAKRRGLPREAKRTIVRAIEVLKQAFELQGPAVLRDLGSAMRDAIDSFECEELRSEYQALVAREVEYIVRSDARIAQLAPTKTRGS